jgi:hypothetical protein
MTAIDPSTRLVFPSVESEAAEIVLLVRPKLENQLRRLRASRSGSKRELKRAARGDGALRSDLWWRLRSFFGRDEQAELAVERSHARIEVSDLMEQLDLKIQRFLDLAAFAGLPGEYQQDLRESKLELSRLYEKEAQKSELSPETFRRLNEIVDLVQLTRRDIQRRGLEDPVLAANFVRSWLPADQVASFTEALDLPLGCLEKMPEGLSDEHVRRIRLAAQLIFDLRFSHTPQGLVDWFYQSFPEFDDRKPVELIKQPECAQRLRTWARSLRTQLAS